VDPVFAAAAAVADGDRRAALVTVVGVDGSAPRAAGARMVVYEDGDLVGTVGGGAFEHRLRAEAAAAITDGHPRRVRVHLTRELGMCCGGAMDAFVEPLTPAEPLVIYGAGHVGRAVARLAAPLGFQVTLVDDRPDWLEAPGLPEGVRCVGRDPRRAVGATARGPRACHLIVTHDHALDQELVEALIGEDLRWLGMIGSKTKVNRFHLRLRAAGVSAEALRRLRAPVGLDLGAETPEEIALSVCAELVALRRGKVGPVALLADRADAERDARLFGPPPATSG
jgi:xanthine dehydrogenase accessory factor